jgi:DNA-binding response OmpR family regulator
MADARAPGGWVSEALRKRGYHVEVAPREASCDEVSLADVQVAILLSLSHSWIERACATIRRRTRDLAIVVLGPDNFDAQVHLFEMGADAYLTEPFAQEEVLARVRALLRSHRSHIA